MRERDHFHIFCFVANLAPATLVAILFAIAGVAAGGLQVAIGVRTNPYMSPGRRDRQGFYASQDSGVLNQATGGGAIAKLFAMVFAPDSRPMIRDVMEADRFCGFDGLFELFELGGAKLHPLAGRPSRDRVARTWATTSFRLDANWSAAMAGCRTLSSSTSRSVRMPAMSFRSLKRLWIRRHK